MSFIIVVLCLALLIVLISYFKVDAFIAFLISSILAGIALGIPLEKLPDSVNNGIGSIKAIPLINIAASEFASALKPDVESQSIILLPQ